MKVYRVSKDRQLRSLMIPAIFILISIFLTPLILELRNIDYTFDNYYIISFAVPIFFYFVLPPAFLHIDYIIQNLGSELKCDFKAERMEIIKKGNVYAYNFNDISDSVLHKSIYHKNKVDNKGRWLNPTIDYGYWYVSFKDGERFIFSNLMIELDIPFRISETEISYRLFQYVRKNEPTKLERAMSKQAKDDRLYQDYQFKYRDYSKE